MTRVVLVDPPWHRLFGSHYNGLPLGICYIASYLNNHKIDTIVYNGDFVNSSEYQTQYDRLKSYKNYLQVINDTEFPIWKKTLDDILSCEPDIVGLSANQVTIKSALNIATLIKRKASHVKVILGGPYPTINHQVYPNIDAYVIGEGEKSMIDFINNPKMRLIQNDYIQNLDDIPFPERNNIFFTGKHLEYGHIITGRGCPFNCIFCASRKIWGKLVRLRSPENVVAEMEAIENNYRCKRFLFRDDTFTINPYRTIDICKKIKNKGYVWQCDTRIDNLSYKVLKTMHDAGCERIKIGVESGDERMLHLIRKGITKDKVRQVVKDSKKIGIDVTTYFIIGLPTETDKELLNTINFIKEINPTDVSISIATPYHGTQLKDMMDMDNENMEKYFHQSPELLDKCTLDKDLIKEIFRISHEKRKKK